MRQYKSILVTGGAGFIGSNFIRYLFKSAGYQGKVVNYDVLTYAGNPLSLSDITAANEDRYSFVRADINDTAVFADTLEKNAVDCVVHFAAESHVDRSIHSPDAFIRTNINGTFSLLSACRQVWKDRTDVLFHHISTDEVYGSLGAEGFFFETTPYDPRSPYSASKAASDHLVMAYYHTYNLPITLSNCSNNYGPYHFPEKLIPLMILNAIEGKKLPVYGEGTNVRDWLHVVDHAAAIWLIITRGRIGEKYNVGGENEWRNIDLVRYLCQVIANHTGKSVSDFLSLISFVEDRKGHDFRYAINCDKIKAELGWVRQFSLERGLDETVRWYLNNSEWVNTVRSGEYQKWIEKNYSQRTQN
jgi:dTDP-glucose 4,6-dehydratase